jgi:hypothetical protein
MIIIYLIYQINAKIDSSVVIGRYFWPNPAPRKRLGERGFILKRERVQCSPRDAIYTASMKIESAEIRLGYIKGYK